MSQVTYNGVSLPWVRTESIDSEVVYNGPDYVHTRHTATVDLLVARGTPGLFLSGETLADVIRRVRHALETPRKDFTFKIGNDTVLSATAATDTGNGPLPEVIGVTQLVGSESAHVRFRVTCHKRECENAGDNPPEYLSHRWSESADVGDDFRTTYRRSGALVIGSNARRNGRPVETVDEFRFLVVPPIPVGFVHKRSHFDVSPDGLTLSYEVEYEEKDLGTMPPAPAVKASGNCVVSTTNGALMHAQVNVRLVGHPRTNKPLLVATAVAVALTRLERAGPHIDFKGDPNGQWKVWGSLSENLYANECEVQLNTVLNSKDRFVAELRAGGRPGDKGDGGNAADNPPPKDPLDEADALGFPQLSNYERLKRELEKKLAVKPAAKPGDNPPPGLLVPKALVPWGFGLPAPNPAPHQTPDPGLRATAGLRLIAALVNDPCRRVELQDVELRGSRGTLAELIASAPGGDLTRYLPGVAARTSALTARVVPDLTESVRDRRQQTTRPPGVGYIDYRLHLEYAIDPHMAAMPEQRDKGLTHFVPLAAESVTLTVSWATERVGDVPAIPERKPPAEFADNVVFLGGSFSPGDVDVSTDGLTLIFRSAGYWKFGFKDPEKVRYGAGLPPWLTALIGGPPRPVVIGGPELLRPDGPLAERVAGGARQVAGAVGDYVAGWRAIWRGFLSGVNGLFR